jgi:ABC-2 type transport system ATP-binding protein
MVVSAIEVEGVTKKYRSGFKEKNVLEGVSFSVGKGQAFGFIGANGAGKSTTIKIILDLIRADSGSVRINGVDSRSAMSRKGVSFMPENPYLNEYLTPLEIVKLGVNMHDVHTTNINSYCMEWLEKLGMSHAANKNIKKMSKGMAQRTGLAHCLAVKPDVLILDEPLSGLDPLGRIDVVDLLVEYHSNGGTLLFTSHVLHDVERIADSFALIKSGRIEKVKTREELLFDSGSYTIVIHSDNIVEGYSSIGGGRWSKECSKDFLWKEIESIKAKSLWLVSITPQLNLESLFLDSLRSDS